MDQDHLQHVVTQRAEDHRHHCPNHGHCTIFPPDGVVGEKPDPRTIHRTDRHGEECLRQRQIDESAVLRRICTDVHQFLRSNVCQSNAGLRFTIQLFILRIINHILSTFLSFL